MFLTFSFENPPVRHASLSVFPLFTELSSEVDYLLADEAIAAEAVIVKEVSESGSVPDLLVENKGDARVLFLEGEELVGAKQNRILNTSVLVAAHSTTNFENRFATLNERLASWSPWARKWSPSTFSTSRRHAGKSGIDSCLAL